MFYGINVVKFVICDHNRDGESYRSPWTNQYYFVNKDGDCVEQEGLWKPSERLRTLEKHANEVFDSYRKLYYGKDGSSVSSVYLWDNNNLLNDKDKPQGSSFSFSGCFLIRNQIKDTTKNINKASWNSTHVVDISIISGNEQNKALYKLTSTVQLSILPRFGNKNDTANHLGGSLTRQTEKVCPIPSNDDDNDISHIINIGKMLEEMETDMRSNMDVLYLQKTREIVDCMYSKESKKQHGTSSTFNKQHTMLLNQALLARSQKKT